MAYVQAGLNDWWDDIQATAQDVGQVIDAGADIYDTAGDVIDRFDGSPFDGSTGINPPPINPPSGTPSGGVSYDPDSGWQGSVQYGTQEQTNWTPWLIGGGLLVAFFLLK